MKAKESVPPKTIPAGNLLPNRIVEAKLHSDWGLVYTGVEGARIPLNADYGSSIDLQFGMKQSRTYPFLQPKFDSGIIFFLKLCHFLPNFPAFKYACDKENLPLFPFKIQAILT